MIHSSVQYTRAANPKDICNFIRDNGPSRRVEIMNYITNDITKRGISSISQTTANNWLKNLKTEGKIKQRGTKYSLPKSKKTENQKKIPKTKELSENQDNVDQQQNKKLKIMKTFSETVEKEVKLAQSMYDVTLLLDSTILLLDTILADSPFYKNTISEAKYKCKICLASIKKIIDEEFVHFIEPHENKYQTSIEDAWKLHTTTKHTYEASMKFYRTSDFRDVFSDVILQMRQSCEYYCKDFVQRATDYEDTVYTSCKLVSTSLNKICRNDYDLVVDSYEYDEKLEMFKINISELKMLSSYTITQLYCNGKNCVFDINSEKKSDSDYTISFYPDGIVNENSIHVISVMIQCVEFSFVINGKQREYFTFLDHIENDVTQIDLIYPQCKSNTIMLTPQIGGKIKDTIESYNDKKFDCSYCEESHPCKRWLGYLHDNGTPDKDDKKYWMMIKCHKSDNYVSLHKILNWIVKE